MGTTVLFVCTGNTCRSPMAEAIARHRLGVRCGVAVVGGAGRGGAGRGGAGGGGAGSSEGGGVGQGGVRVVSAGVTAADGSSYSAEIGPALASVGVSLPSGGRSRVLTRELIASADRIYAMTSSHARAVLLMDPTSADRVELLDPSGRDVPDPFGGPASVYEATARAIDEMIAERMPEWEEQ